MNPLTLVDPVTMTSQTIQVMVDPDGDTTDASDQVVVAGSFTIADAFPAYARRVACFFLKQLRQPRIDAGEVSGQPAMFGGIERVASVPSRQPFAHGYSLDFLPRAASFTAQHST